MKNKKKRSCLFYFFLFPFSSSYISWYDDDCEIDNWIDDWKNIFSEIFTENITIDTGSEF